MFLIVSILQILSKFTIAYRAPKQVISSSKFLLRKDQIIKGFHFQIKKNEGEILVFYAVQM